jgi:hypothetical protein
MTSLSDVEPAGGGGHLAVLKIELSQKKREMVTHGKWMVNWMVLPVSFFP